MSISKSTKREHLSDEMQPSKKKRKVSHPEETPRAGGTAVGKDAPKQSSAPKGAARQARSERHSKKPKVVRDREETPSHNPEQPQLSNKPEVTGVEADKTGNAIPASKSSKGDRFIVFVGNLPYSTTTAAIAAHFSKLSPSSIRHSTNPESGKSKGFAFLEFDGYEKMSTCLKLYHRSMFDPDKTAAEPAPKPKADVMLDNVEEIEGPDQTKIRDASKRDTAHRPRRINVELTAGGGGKSSNRKDRIKVKNTKLNEQRERARKKETAAKTAKQKGIGEAAVTGEKIIVKTQAAEKPTVDNDDAQMHPSRLKRMKH